MDVRVTRFLDGAREARGRAVIVDVFRAFTTAAYCVAAGAREVVLLADHAEALAMKEADRSCFLTGEIGGRPIDGFDVGNSPSRIVGLDLVGRRVVQRTSAGTQGVNAAAGADEILLGSLVIAGATVRYLAARPGDVTVVAMGLGARELDDSDEAAAELIAARLLGADATLRAIRLEGDHDRAGWPEWFPRRDAELALELDRFDFALPVVREGGLLIARPAFV
ncbi:MAG: 2-phosphosulfolactate phosphatase [Chloroflexota bacterium]